MGIQKFEELEIQPNVRLNVYIIYSSSSISSSGSSDIQYIRNAN